MKEVSEAIDRAKNGKAHLAIPNEALKNPNSKASDWRLCNIIPIPKPDKDPRLPLQNRCISVLCCVTKVYSNILNKRIQAFLESNQILVEEQNGFRACRSCIYHIYVLVTVL